MHHQDHLRYHSARAVDLLRVRWRAHHARVFASSSTCCSGRLGGSTTLESSSGAGGEKLSKRGPEELRQLVKRWTAAAMRAGDPSQSRICRRLAESYKKQLERLLRQ